MVDESFEDGPPLAREEKLFWKVLGPYVVQKYHEGKIDKKITKILVEVRHNLAFIGPFLDSLALQKFLFTVISYERRDNRVRPKNRLQA